MTFRLVMTKKDPRRTDFVLVGEHAAANAQASKLYKTSPGAGKVGRKAAGAPPVYTSYTTHYAQPCNGSCATTTITRTDPGGDRFQVGVIEWPAHSYDRAQLVVGTRDVQMVKSGIFTSPERFTAADGYMYEWQIQDARPQLVPLRTYSHASASYVATFVQSQSCFFLWRRHTSSLYIPPEGFHILDDIIVTFIYFEGKWRDKESAKSHAGLSAPVM